jgi:hypothetical protein
LPLESFDVEEVHAAVLHARELAGGEASDEPAAMFFAFASRPATFPKGWRTMAHLLAMARVNELGCKIYVDSGGFDSLCRKIEAEAMTYGELRQWFAGNMKPIR